MNCEKCNKACSIPLCASSIQLGRIEAVNTSVYVTFTEIITGRKKHLQVTSDDSGNIIIDASSIQPFFSPNFIYNISVSSDLSNACPDIDLFIGNISVSCVEVTFYVCIDEAPATSIIRLENETDTIDDDSNSPIQDDSFNYINT